MKVLQVINVRWYNAEADYCLKLTKSLGALGVDVTLMGLPDSPVIQKAEAAGLMTVSDINPNSQNPVSVLKNYLWIKKFLRANKFDIVNFHRSEGFIIGAFACHAANARVVRTRGDMRPVKKGFTNRLLYNNHTDFIITSGDIIKQSIIDRLQADPRKVQTVYTTVDTGYFTPEKKSNKLHKELGISEDTKLVAILGRLGDVKGHDHFIKAARIVKKNYKNVKFLIIGKEIDNEGAGLKELVAELKLEDDVIFMLGMRRDIDEVVASVDVGVITSTASEANCRVAIEWMSSGVPVAAFATGVIPEVVTDGLDGAVVPTGDYKALAERVIELLDSDNWSRLSKGARNSAIERFDIKLFGEKTLEIYRNI